MTERGVLYGVGVGPGDPELMTVKAVRLLKACDVIAIPQRDKDRCAAFRIAAQAVPEIENKPLLALDMPMTRHKEARERAFSAAAEQLTAALAAGRTVAFLTLGDPTIYSTYGYLHGRVAQAGFEAIFVPGVPSFCAAAAALGVSLCADGEALHILPGPRADGGQTGTRVFMKGGAPDVKRALQDHDGFVWGAENVGMAQERLYRSVEEIPEDVGYFTLIIAKEREL